ncbi:YdiK family protein [Bacillus xiapuensis]|uniref:YdiK family protein n=1 Tax=Bacillus xiapuensis TaxID=2014075 RepID=UPI000C236C24|nr:YdiK family protein [Bacillus xiapuensis]
MTQSPLKTGIFYLLAGVLFTYLAVENVNSNGDFGFFAYLFILLATMDIGTGIRLVFMHFRFKNKPKK